MCRSRERPSSGAVNIVAVLVALRIAEIKIKMQANPDLSGVQLVIVVSSAAQQLGTRVALTSLHRYSATFAALRSSPAFPAD
ncbi:uncharacterized protein LOC62_02G002681 [Vanrija pseudolonga]|uniref:Uncharacterized protein n=1 Tax=Vanrija pseudolonga TaxID=143232 RepID=A0AAF0Y776_9TREE|nr:hypothetical protein LOC62_02G002681 [Vanrija pseudolonga]